MEVDVTCITTLKEKQDSLAAVKVKVHIFPIKLFPFIYDL